MEIAEFVRIGRDLLKMMSENDVKVTDWKYLKMFDKYKVMRKNGIKYRAAILELALEHSISTSKAERIIRRLQKHVK